MLAPMLAVTGQPAEVLDGFAYEFKWDGVRATVDTDGEALIVRSRRGADVTAAYPELADLPAALGRDALLDGEIVAFDDQSRPSFARLQERMHLRDPNRVAQAARQVPVAYLAFDLLRLDGTDLTAEPYETRRELLEDLDLTGAHWQVPPRQDDLEVALNVATELGLEGVIAKRVGSRYQPGRRSPDWRKLRLLRRQEFVVGGFKPGRGSRSGTFASLLLGVQGGDGLTYTGSVGSGFSDRELERLRALLDDLRTDVSPFAGPVPIDNAVFVEPRLVVDVRFAEWTPDELLRQPVYLGQRTDRDPATVVREEP